MEQGLVDSGITAEAETDCGDGGRAWSSGPGLPAGALCFLLC